MRSCFLSRMAFAITFVFAQASTGAAVSFYVGHTYQVGTAPCALALRDLNHDGRRDIVVANCASGNVSVLLNNGYGSFRAAGTYAVGPWPYSIDVGDFNGDGKLDLLVITQGATVGVDGRARILFGKGDGTFYPVFTAWVGPSPRAAGAVDFNRDGKSDLLVTNADNNVRVFLSNGNGSFRLAGSAVSIPGGSSTGVGDFNGDSLQDFVVMNSDLNGVNVYLGRGDGTFRFPVRSTTIPAVSLTSDINGDGRSDDELITTRKVYLSELGWKTKYYLTVSKSNGDGTFSSSSSYPSDCSGWCPLRHIGAGDFNHDGKRDIVGTGWSYSRGNELLLFLNSGGGAFSAPPLTFALPFSPESLAVGDVNGDGVPDVVLANIIRNSITILITVPFA